MVISDELGTLLVRCLLDELVELQETSELLVYALECLDV